MSEMNGRDLVDQLDKNYNCLHGQYRLGGFERLVPYVRKWQPDASTPTHCFMSYVRTSTGHTALGEEGRC